MSNGNGHHWSKFSWRDWHSDIALHPCSLAARGFWIELLCMMHEGSPIGHLATNGRQVTIRQMALNAGCSEKEAARLLAELEASGVFSRTEDGTIYSRRMVKDAVASGKGAEAAGKRWNGHRPNGSPNGSPNGEASRQPNGIPNAKNKKVEVEVDPPRTPPANGGEARRDRKSGRPSKNAFHDLAREFDAEVAEKAATIEGTADEVADFQAFYQRRLGVSHG